MSRYKNYEHCSASKEDSTAARRLIADISSERELSHASANGVQVPNGPNSRLEYIINAMSYIRGELVSFVN